MEQNSETPMIECIGLTKRYLSGRIYTAVQRANLTVKKGEMVSVIGPSGSGKSSLLNLIGCLLRPTEGELKIDGTSVISLSENRLTKLRRDKIGFIFQFFNLMPSLSAQENVALPLHLRGWPRSKIEARAEELLALVGLSWRTAFQPDEMSGGERQRVAIARALASEPALLLADEPTGNLDSVTGAEILKLLHDVNQRLGCTILMVTHDSKVARSCPRTITIRDAQIVSDEMNTEAAEVMS
jgi:putative ABC transport system ATP-binding protein